MATPLYTCGFESGNVSFYQDEGWQNISALYSSAGMTHKDFTDSGSSYALKAAAVASKSPVISTSSRWLHFWAKPESGGFDLVSVTFLRAGSEQFAFRMNASGYILLLLNGSQVAISSSAINPNVAHWWAVEFIGDNAGTCDIYVDDQLIIAYSGDTQFSGTSGWDQFSLSNFTVTLHGTAFDDIIVTNAAQGKIVEHFGVGLFPNGSDVVEMDPSSGTNYDAVGEVPASLTNYVEADETGDQDTYTLPSMPAAQSVLAVTVWAWASRQATITTGELIVKSGVTLAYSTPSVLSASPTYSVIRASWGSDPDIAGDWTETTINSLIIGLRFA
jgi:hypothetical protein